MNTQNQPTAQKIQYVKEAIQLPKLNKEDKTFVQKVIGVFLFYGQSADETMVCPLSVITMYQANPTQEAMKK